MVLRVLVLKVRIPLPALLLSEILKVLGAILSVAELELIARPYARAASVGWMRVVTLPCSVLHPRATGARAGAKLTPCPPVPVLFQDVWCQPDAVAFKAVLGERIGEVQNEEMVVRLDGLQRSVPTVRIL